MIGIKVLLKTEGLYKCEVSVNVQPADMSTTGMLIVEVTRRILHQDPDPIYGLESNSDILAPVWTASQNEPYQC